MSKSNTSSILVLGGFGYRNVGDEAQLSADLADLTEYFPDSNIKILSPNPEYTSVEHPGFDVMGAPRTIFYNQGKSVLYNIKLKNRKSPIHYVGNEVFKILFILKSLLFLFNAHLIKRNLPGIFLSRHQVELIKEVKNSEFVFFEGGGYLTGSTLSRFWDGMYFIRIANVFNKKVFLSGQTLGVWTTLFNERLARKSLSKADLISVRDPEDSYNALKDLGLDVNKFKVICDDALFCEKMDLSKIEYLSKFNRDKYFTYHLHYWGAEKKDEIKKILNTHKMLIQELLEKYDHDIVLLSMTPSDEQPISDLIKEIKSDRLHFFEHNYNYREIRSLIAGSEVCITMKHHPIIFAMGELVPVLSITYTDYYEHKNKGALRLFNQEKYNINIENEGIIEDSLKLLDEILESKEELKNTISKNLDEREALRKEFFDSIRSHVSNNDV